jgi:hypothetical protein
MVLKQIKVNFGQGKIGTILIARLYPYGSGMPKLVVAG